MIIQRAGAAEVPQIVGVEKRCFECHWAERQYLSGLDNNTLRLITASDGSSVLGYVAYTVMVGEMEILNIAVVPEARRQGLGRKMLRAVLNEGIAEKVEACFLDVRVSNVPAIGLYTEFGFEQVGRRKRYYPDNREDALLFRLDMDTDHTDEGVIK